MSSRKYIIVFVLLAVLFIATKPCFAMEIQNFRAGLVCSLELEVPDSEIKIPVSWVCFETETINLTGQGKCTFNKQEKHCTWYGFQFDYTDADVGDEITCNSKSDSPRNLGNPTEVTEEGVTEANWQISLPPGDGHYYNPQFTVLPVYVENAHFSTTETVCEFDGIELFRFRFTVNYPEIGEPQVLPSLERLFENSESSNDN